MERESVVDGLIAENRKRREAIDEELERLKSEAFSLDVEYRAYVKVRQGLQSAGTAHTPPRAGLLIDLATRPSVPKGEHQFRLSPLWADVFAELVQSYPKYLTRDRIKEIGQRHGPISPSFHTAFWHHVKRGNIDERDGLYFANEQTAKRVGKDLRNSA
jgi:hypothetical protein